jgi:hypothetical protein
MQPPLKKGNQVRKPLSKDEILNCIIGTEQERPKYKPSAPMLSEPNLEAAVGVLDRQPTTGSTRSR